MKKRVHKKVSKRESPSKIWGGRFDHGPEAIMERINSSIDFDKRLFAQDIEGSKAHAAMLVAQGLITAQDGRAIQDGLDRIRNEIEQGQFDFKPALEDIHMNIEARLSDLIGEPAGYLHTARSRNDQVATDFKLWVRETLDQLDAGLKELQIVLTEKADTHTDTIMPGFSHLQNGQPVTFGHHCLAYVEMFARDRGRLTDARRRLNESPLGSAALAGTSFPIDREMTSQALGFERPTRNSLDSVSDRDFALEALNAAAICAIHLSRLGEELVIWMSSPFQFISLSDAFTTGSSLMPQKRNPDAAELIRAKTGRIFAAQIALQTVMKGLPLAYAKDLQEDKELTFDALDALNMSIAVMSGMIGDMTVNADAMEQAAHQGHTTATDLADWIVRVLNKPFRNAHHIAGRLVAVAEKQSVALDALTLDQMKDIEPGITNDVYSVLSVKNSVASRTSFGGTAPANVAAQVQQWKKRLS